MDQDAVDPVFQDGATLRNKLRRELGLRLEKVNALMGDDGNDGTGLFQMQALVQPLKVIVATSDGTDVGHKNTVCGVLGAAFTGVLGVDYFALR